MIYNRINQLALLREAMKDPDMTEESLQILESLFEDFSDMTDAEFQEIMTVWSYEVDE